ncbi:MAG TPA: prepilin peptidase [Pseudobacteroides sp.]|uniref:prepilin peptidase n=1 Tax=Pseudobacteroides sp. TaxID=1968840 RepID=UPI002F9590C6
MTVYYYILVFTYGLIIGSFLNVCIYRMPLGESVVKPPSHCPKCGTRLTVFDLVPLFSYLFLRGKCRYCKVKIPIKYLMMELLTAIIYLPLFYKYGQSGQYIEFFAAAFLMSILIVVFFIDLKHRKIPNSLVIIGFLGSVAVIVYNFFRPLDIYGDGNWWNPIVGMVSGSGFLLIVSLICMGLLKKEAFGFGDIKLFAVIGGYIGWKMGIVALLISFVISALAVLIGAVLKREDKKGNIAFGSFISVGTYITLLFGGEIIKLFY